MIHIACCFDSNFQLPFVVLASSIERHTKSPVVLHALHDGPLRYSKNLVRQSELFQCRFKDIAGTFPTFPTYGHPATVTYARLVLAQLLPGIPRLLYLDVDMIVRRDLSDLYNADLGGKPLGAVIDYPLAARAANDETFKKADKVYVIRKYLSDFIGVSDFLSYFNTGMLLMEMHEFGNEKHRNEMVTFLNNYASQLIFNDQDAINFVFKNQFEALDPRWNAMNNELVATSFGHPMPMAIVDAIALGNDPWIIHYAGCKPWNEIHARHPWDKKFWEEAFNHGSAAWLLLVGLMKSVGGSRLSKLERYPRRALLLCLRHGPLKLLRLLVKHRLAMSSSRKLA